MKQILTLLVLYILSFSCQAQGLFDSTKVFDVNKNEETSLDLYTQIFTDNTTSYSIPEILQTPFISYKDFKKRVSPENVNSAFYLKIHFRNTSENSISGYFFPGLYFASIDLYKLGKQPEKIIFKDYIPGYRKLILEAGEESTYLVVLKMVKNDFNYITPQFIKGEYLEKYISHVMGYKTDTQIYGLILSGVLIMMLLFMITNYILSRKSEFFYNAMYSLCMFFLILLNSSLVRTTGFFPNLYFSYLDFFLLVSGTVFYITFIRKFLNTKLHYELLDKVLKYGVQFVLLLLGIYTFLNFFTKTYLPQFYLENLMKIFMLGIGITFVLLAINKHDRLFNYIAMGNAAIVFFSLISLSMILSGIKSISFFNSAIVYYNTGVVVELVFFLLGLTYKTRQEIIKGIQQQEAFKLEAEKQAYETQIAVIKAQQEVRNKISADMHDDLGAGMTTISLYSELAKRKLYDNPIPEIDKISSSANELLNKMNAIIWSMSSSNDSLNNTIAYIRSYAIEYFEDTGVTCNINIPENLPNITVIGEIRRNVFLVVKEALNNILKHAKATEVNLNLIKTADGITLYIHDNGAGIDFDKLRQFSNGLKNMKKRMQDINVEFSIENNHGTLITLHRKIDSF